MIDIINATYLETAKRVRIELEADVDPNLLLRLFIYNRTTKAVIPYSESQDHFAEYTFSGEEEAQEGDVVEFEIDCTVLYSQNGDKIGTFDMMVYTYNGDTEKIVESLQPGRLKLHKVLPLGA